MPELSVLPYGSWPSPITFEMAVSSSVRLSEPQIFGSDVYWTEGRPAEGGRQVIVRWNETDGAQDVTPPPYNARTMIHEYGGGWYTVDERDGTLYFCNLPDGRVYRCTRNGQPQPLTAEGAQRYGDLVFDATHERIVCIREDHAGIDGSAVAATGNRLPEPVNELVAIDVRTGAVSVLTSGYDFYSSPRVNDGQLAWMAWRHPNMPWDATELWVADVDRDGALHDARMIAGSGGSGAESNLQPEWAPDGSLVYISDRTGWWNLYRWSDACGSLPILPMAAEFGGPQWVFGLSWYSIAQDGTIYAAVSETDSKALLAIAMDGSHQRLDVPDEFLTGLRAGTSRLVYLGGGAAQPASIVLLDFEPGSSAARRRVLCQAFELKVDPAWLARPEAIEFPTSQGDTAYALYYPPTNPDFSGPAGERPPLVVMSHGGPTSSVAGNLDMEKNVFTSRGIAVVDVNYRGSTGHGREYMRRLYGNWGIFDVDDCIAAAQYLATRGDIDGQRMAITGGSAGGYTTLAALTFHDVFAAGASHFGVGDLEALARDTHKFESRYLDQLVAPYPEGIALYRERSPIHHVDQLSRPLIVLQGREDHVVPIDQAEQIVAALRTRHIPHAYLVFEGEGHGFRRAQNILRALEAELSFYAQVFDFRLADDIEPVEVAFLVDR